MKHSKIPEKLNRRWIIRNLAVLAAVAWLILSAAGAAVAAGTVAQTYNAGPSVLPGMIVEPESKDQATVVPASGRDVSKSIGVVAPVDGADIVLTPPSVSEQQVLVAPSGRYNLLVSNQNGSIKAGDYLTISALDGISMKAGSDRPEVIGRAVGSFNGSSNAIGTEKLSTSAGQHAAVAIGVVPVDIRLGPNPLYHDSSNLPGWLSKAGSSVANKPVSSARFALSLGVLAATLFMAGSMFYGGIRGGVTAIGRNPLAKKAVSRGVLQAGILGMIVLVLGVFAAYAILV